MKPTADPPNASAPSSAPPTLTVGGVTFTAEQIKIAVVIIDGREIHIGEKEAAPQNYGFPSNQPNQPE